MVLQTAEVCTQGKDSVFFCEQYSDSRICQSSETSEQCCQEYITGGPYVTYGIGYIST